MIAKTFAWTLAWFVMNRGYSIKAAIANPVDSLRYK